MATRSSTALSRVAAAVRRLWRHALELAILCILSLQDVCLEVLLALWALRLRDARLTLPRTTSARLNRVRGSNNYSSSDSDSASDVAGSDYGDEHDSDAATRSSTSASTRRHTHPRGAALAFLEKFRHGPADQSEWNLFLWRVTFPMIPLVLFTLFAVVGKMGHAPYSLLVCPVWYLCNFVLVVYPFDVVFRFPDIDAPLQRTLSHALVATSVAIAGVEWYVSSPQSRVSWGVGNTLFGVVALVGIPLFFATQNRVPRAEHGSRSSGSGSGSSTTAAYDNDNTDDDQRHTSLESALRAAPASLSSRFEDAAAATVSSMRQRSLPAVTAATPADAHIVVHDAAFEPYTSHSDGASNSYVSRVTSNISSGAVTSDHTTSGRAETLPPSVLLASPGSSSGTSNTPARQQLYSHATLNRPPPANRKSKLLVITAISIAAVWLAMFMSYNTSRSSRAVGAASRYWFLTYALSPVLCIVLFATRQQHTHFSLDHVMVYAVLVVHLPVFLGHFCLRLFAMVEDAGGSSSDGSNTGAATVAADAAVATGSSWLKLAISVLYLLTMQGYFFVITHVVNAMAEPFAHPSLLYVGQLYYYLFWYILVGSDTPIDMLYWGMLLVNNVHIALLNTGIYTDVKRSSLTCSGGLGAFPLGVGVGVGSSVAVCFRATTARLRAEAAAISTDSARPSGVRSSGAMTDDDGDDDDDEQQRLFDASESEGFVSDQDAVLSPLHAKLRRAARRSRRSQASGSARPESSSSLLPLSPVLTSSSGDVRRNSRKRRIAASGVSLVSHPRASLTSLSSSSSTAAEQLKPLYFLMKLAEQDNMADTTALILVPSLLTLMAVFDKPSAGLTILYDQRNMWLRCICMFIGRLGGSFLAREIFAYKLKARLRTATASATDSRGSSNNATIGTIEGLSTRLWIQRLMLQDFHRQFWYLTVVTIVVTFACFDRVDLPLRFALLT